VSMVVAAAPVIAVIIAAIAIVALMRTAWENDWGGIQGKVAAVTAWLKTTIETVMTGIRTFWENNGQQILAIAESIWSLVQQTIENYLTYIRSVFDLFAALFRGDWEEFGAKLVEVWRNAWILVRDFLAGFWDLIRPVLENLWAAIRDWWNGIDWASLGRSIIDGIVSAITGGAGRITGAISGIVSGIRGAIGGAIPGFQTGGFTGFLPETAIAGFVHGNEYVFSAPAVRRIGLSNLEAMHRGQAVGGGNITFASGSIAVYAAPGMDERRLAERVVEAVNRKLGSQADSRMR
jgi:phage-related protein